MGLPSYTRCFSVSMVLLGFEIIIGSTFVKVIASMYKFTCTGLVCNYKKAALKGFCLYYSTRYNFHSQKVQNLAAIITIFLTRPKSIKLFFKPRYQKLDPKSFLYDNIVSKSLVLLLLLIPEQIYDNLDFYLGVTL